MKPTPRIAVIGACHRGPMDNSGQTMLACGMRQNGRRVRAN
jgi:hypothetical protein